jgi:hypothetical protein
LVGDAAEGCPPKKAGGRYRVKSEFKGESKSKSKSSKAGGTPALRTATAAASAAGKIGYVAIAWLNGARTVYCGLGNSGG